MKNPESIDNFVDEIPLIFNNLDFLILLKSSFRNQNLVIDYLIENIGKERYNEHRNGCIIN